MPILSDFKFPSSAGDLQVTSDSPLFIGFLASKDLVTKKPWCPDVVAALPILEATFQGGNQPTVAFVDVGQRPEWKDPKNVFRTKWSVHNTPTLARFEKVGDEVKEVGRLVDSEILDQERLQKLIQGA